MRKHGIVRLGAAVACLTLSGFSMPAAQAQETAPLFTQEQATRAVREYTRSCSDCHGPNLDDGEFGGPPLRGMAFRDKWFGMPADALIQFMMGTMPPDRPGTFSLQTYTDILALILSHNGFEPGDTELPADLDALAEIIVE